MYKLFISFLFLSFLLGGCQTLRNTAKGLGETAKGFGKGIVEDTKSAFRAIKKADDWFREHAW